LSRRRQPFAQGCARCPLARALRTFFARFHGRVGPRKSSHWRAISGRLRPTTD
jgi:hypothetical protein